ncbi:MAG: Tm-1-like ATP-binding domain-containing protein, partial [Planctomycetaceae bacterium]|nr:Tm-1-like ATP-binding domain-containing protein [Planctomycetaceae bacterium]
TVVVPEGGVSALDAPGEAFHNPAANEALFSELRATLQQDSVRKLVFAPHHINDPEFAQLLLDEFHVLLSGRATS